MPPGQEAQQGAEKLGSRELIAIQLAMDAGATEATLQNEHGEDVTLSIAEAIFYTKADYAEQCELFDRYIETKTTGGKSMADVLNEAFPLTGELPPGTSEGGIKAYIAITAMQKALTRKFQEARPAITGIINEIYLSKTTLPTHSLLSEHPVEKPFAIGLFHIESLTKSEQYSLVAMYVNLQLQTGKRTPQDLAREVELDLDINAPNDDDFIQLAIKKLDFAIRCEQKAKTEKAAEERIAGPNTLGGFLKKSLDRGETQADSRELAMFFERYQWGEYRTNPQMIHLLEAILSEEFLQQAGEKTVKEFAEKCIALSPEEGRNELLGIIFRFDPIEGNPRAPSSILNKIASELRGEEQELSPLPEGKMPPDDARLPFRTRSRTRIALAAAALAALGLVVVGNFDRIRGFFPDAESTPPGAAASGESQPTRGTLWDASAEADSSVPPPSLGTVMEETRKRLAEAEAIKADSETSAPTATTGPAATDASTPAPKPQVNPPEPPKPAPAQAETKSLLLPIFVKTIQFGPKAGQTEIDLTQSKKAWEALGYTVTTSLDMATRTKTLILTDANGNTIKFPENTAVTAGQAQLSVEATKQ